jgi:hypothetical protein
VSRVIRSRRAPVSRDLPLYARMLGLRHLAPSGFLCFVFLEGAVALGILLALAELVSWWGVLVLPITVAAMVKLNDMIAGVLTRPAVTAAAAGTASVTRPAVAPAPAVTRPMVRQPVAPARSMGEFSADEHSLARARSADLRNPEGAAPAADFELRMQQARQSAARRYE